MKTMPITHPRDLKHVIPLGTKISRMALAQKSTKPGTVGRLIEQYVSLQTGLPLRKKGPDLKIGTHYCEIKSRQVGLQSAVCFGTTSKSEIMYSHFYNTGLYQQLENLYYIWYDDQGIVVDADVYDMTEYRTEAQYLFNEAKTILRDDEDCKYINDHGTFYLERTGSSIFQLRCNERQMLKLQHGLKCRPIFDEFFDVAD
jgi:hypothetical protein